MIELPKECEVNKFLAKKIFYEKVNISTSIKQEFVDKLEKITWKYKISENNINVSKTENVEEIEIFELVLKEKYDAKNIVKVITKEIPYPILFYINYNDEFQYAIKYEDNIFFTEWNDDIKFDFLGLNLEIVYENIVKLITNIDSSTNNVKDELERKQEIQKIKNEIAKLENQMKKEQQFNKKVELNKKISILRGDLEKIVNKNF